VSARERVSDHRSEQAGVSGDAAVHRQHIRAARRCDALAFLRHATRPTLTTLLRFFGSDTRAVAAARAATLAADPARLAALEATLRASIGASRRRQGMNNDFVPFTPAPLSASHARL